MCLAPSVTGWKAGATWYCPLWFVESLLHKMHARWFVQCYRGHCVIKVLIFGTNKGAFYAYAYIMYVYNIRIMEYYARIYVRVCFRSRSRCTLCAGSWSGYVPTLFSGSSFTRSLKTTFELFMELLGGGIISIIFILLLTGTCILN
jgi:hypothetical protein